MNEKQIKMFQVLEEINCLHLDCLDEDWVQAIYHSEFLEIADFPADYESAVESVNISSVFHKVMRAVDTWLGLEAESEEDKSWAALSAQVPHQRLLAVLSYFIDYGTKNVHTKEYRNNALLASRVYYKFLSIPGYKAYHIYHAQLFTHSLACLSFPKEMCEKDENYFNTKELTREVNSVIRELRPYVLDLRSIVEKLQLKPTDMNFEDILSHLVDITGGAIVNKLNIDKLELANISQVIYVMIDTLIQDSTGEPDAVSIRLLFKCLLPKLVAASADCKNANNLVRASYVTYSGLLLSKYGKAAVSGFTVLLQHLCYTLDGLERAEVRQARVQLVVGMMTLLPRKSYRQTVKWLLKLTTTAKISHRYVALEILAKLLSNENDPEAVVEPPPPEPQPTAEVAAVEGQPQPADNQAPEQPQGNEPSSDQPAGEQLIGDQISNNQPPSDQAACDQPAVDQTDENQPGGDQTVNNQPIGSQAATDQLPGDLPVCDQLTGDQPASDLPTDQQLPTDLPLDDLMSGDKFPIDSFSGDQPPCEEPVDLMEQPLNEGDTPAEPPPVEGTKNSETEANSEMNKQVEVSTEDESSQEMPVPKGMQCKVVLKPLAAEELKTYVVDPEEEVAGLLRARPHKVPHKDVLRAVHERANDISSTLRTRALTILADCCASNRLELKEALKEINGSGEVSRLVALAARCMSDERAAVRRAALLLMHKLMATNEENVTETNLGVLVSVCRDASILVRGAAITSVGHLVVQWGRAAVMHAFLTGPVHQLSDPEPKIQEQVIVFIQQMLVERLEKFSPSGCEDLLPWTFLGAIAKHNMRRHLQKACTLLAKTAKCISVRTVDLLSTHLGALSDERDLQTLVMLTSVARHVDYHDVGFVLDYYYTLTEDMQGRDARLLPLVLELITEWSHWVTGAARAELRAHLVKALGAAQYGSDSCRTACAALAAHLDPVNLQWATELMQFYESRALNGGSIEEWVCAADMSLVAPQPPAPALLKLFLANVETPPPGQSYTVLCYSYGQKLVSDESRALNGGSIEEWVCAADMSLVAPQPPAPALLKLFLANVETPPPGQSYTVLCYSYGQKLVSDESRALNGGSIEEWVCAADMSLVAPQPPAPALLKLFLANVETPPPGQSYTVLCYSYGQKLVSDESRALNGGSIEEWVCAADMSLVAPQPPAPALLKLFLANVETPPPGQSYTVLCYSYGQKLVSDESRALNGGSIEEWVCAADMSLVAPQPPAPALLKLFLANVETPPPGCDAESRGCMIAGLGRLCVRSRDAAAAAAPPLSKVLFSQSEPIAARVNALLALTDICTRYTCIVEPLLSSVMACLSRDTPPALRHAAVTALTRLLLAGYLRLRTPLYYRYCALLADEDHDVREPAEYYVTCCLTADTIYHHFVECVLHYNKDDQTGPEKKVDDNSAVSGSPVPQHNAGPEKEVVNNLAASGSPVSQQNPGPEKEVVDNLAASGSPVSQQNPGPEKEVDVFLTASGSPVPQQNAESISFDARQLIYDVMLQRMSLVQKLNIQCRLAREVLGHAADMCDEGDEELSPSLQAALLDTITLLCGPRMKLPRKPDRNAGDADIDDLHERVTTNIVSHKMKRTVAEVLVPAVLRLYARMRSRGGQVVAYLVRIATDLLKDYRQEIEELIENDEELVDKVRQFQENIGEEPSFGNTRNLVTTSTSTEPETPRPSRRRPNHRTPRSARGPPAKRSLRV